MLRVLARAREKAARVPSRCNFKKSIVSDLSGFEVGRP
jgi:hypothetical protein